MAGESITNKYDPYLLLGQNWFRVQLEFRVQLLQFTNVFEA